MANSQILIKPTYIKYTNMRNIFKFSLLLISSSSFAYAPYVPYVPYIPNEKLQDLKEVSQHISNNEINQQGNTSFIKYVQGVAETIVMDTASRVVKPPVSSDNKFSGTLKICGKASDTPQWSPCLSHHGNGDLGPAGGIIIHLNADGVSGVEMAFVEGFIGNLADSKQYVLTITEGGFSDWRLPNTTELNAIYHNLHFSGVHLMKEGFYWSSAYFHKGYGMVYDMQTGYVFPEPIGEQNLVVVVRAFKGLEL